MCLVFFLPDKAYITVYICSEFFVSAPTEIFVCNIGSLSFMWHFHVLYIIQWHS